MEQVIHSTLENFDESDYSHILIPKRTRHPDLSDLEPGESNYNWTFKEHINLFIELVKKYDRKKALELFYEHLNDEQHTIRQQERLKILRIVHAKDIISGRSKAAGKHNKSRGRKKDNPRKNLRRVR